MHDDSILFLCHWSDRETIALLEDLHMLESCCPSQFSYRDDPIELLDIFDIHTLPYRLLSGRLRIIVLIREDELGLICMSRRAYSCEPSDPDFRAWWVIEEDSISDLHVVSHIVASKIVAYSEPARWAISCEVIDRVFSGFGFHKPVCHREKWWYPYHPERRREIKFFSEEYSCIENIYMYTLYTLYSIHLSRYVS